MMTTTKKKSGDYPNVSFRLSERQISEVATRANAGKSGAAIAKRDLERYYDVLSRCLPAFSMPEVLVLCKALNGMRCESEVHLWVDVQEWLGEHQSGDVDAASFIARLKALHPMECMAVVDAVERAWNAPTYHIEDMEGRVRQVGLVRG